LPVPSLPLFPSMAAAPKHMASIPSSASVAPVAIPAAAPVAMEEAPAPAPAPVPDMFRFSAAAVASASPFFVPSRSPSPSVASLLPAPGVSVFAGSVVTVPEGNEGGDALVADDGDGDAAEAVEGQDAPEDIENDEVAIVPDAPEAPEAPEVMASSDVAVDACAPGNEYKGEEVPASGMDEVVADDEAPASSMLNSAFVVSEESTVVPTSSLHQTPPLGQVGSPSRGTFFNSAALVELQTPSQDGRVVPRMLSPLAAALPSSPQDAPSGPLVRSSGSLVRRVHACVGVGVGACGCGCGVFYSNVFVYPKCTSFSMYILYNCVDVILKAVRFASGGTASHAFFSWLAKQHGPKPTCPSR
jgi:hypothetical protein